MGEIASLLKTIDPEAVGLHELDENELHQLQRVLADMLDDIAQACEKHQIKWSLFGGSAIGAIRHHGFIPWDDDMDIYMTRDGYYKFREVFEKELGDRYELKCPGDAGFPFAFIKVFKKGTRMTGIVSGNGETEPVFIDIFILENTYNSKFRRKWHGLWCSYYRAIVSMLKFEHCKDNVLKYGRESSELCKEVKKRVFLAKFFHFRSLEKWVASTDKCFSKCKDNNSPLVVCPSGVMLYSGEIYEREKMTDLIKVPFEDKEFYIMRDYDYYLKKRYGEDYMVVPDKPHQERHVFIEFDLGDEYAS